MLKMRIWVQKSALMQKRTSPLKFGDLAEKSVFNSVSNLSTKERGARLDARTSDGLTALHYAAVRGHEAACRVLLGHVVEGKRERSTSVEELILAEGGGERMVSWLWF